MNKPFITCFLLGAVLLTGCGEKNPSREHIPVIKDRFYDLQEAIKARNMSALDSLMSAKMLSDRMDVDSLLRFIYGSEGENNFNHFGEYEIFYTQNKARVDCYLMDSSAARDRPAAFTFILDGDRWLLKRFEAGHPRKELDTSTNE
ncbi:MAG: hypothetical protein PHU88_06205 [candidate division Zixibacteria bacterium]|nr:hypothetical protein [candidate division Zixibacteria bacterium]MDD5425683.1 hypothetical protein [candidate division Zixibacteria bacterium]